MVTKTLFSGALVASLIVALLAGCGGGGSDPAPPVDGVKKILSVGQVSIGGVTIGDAAPGEAVAVDGDVTATYSPATAAVGTLVTTCGPQSLNGTVKTSAAGSVTFGHNAWLYDTDCSATVTFSAADFASVTKTVTFRTKKAPAVPIATVAITATPTTMVVGQSARITWTTMGAANCLASDGWNGPLANTGGSLDVTPTTTTTYSAVCYNADNVATPVVSVTVTVTPKPVKLAYENVVVALRPTMPLVLYGVDRTVPGVYLPVKNLTGKQFYSVGIRMPRADNCLAEVSGLDSVTGAEHKMLFNPGTFEMTMDTTGNQASLVRFRNDDFRQGDYLFFNPADQVVYPLWASMAQVPSGRYYTLNTTQVNLQFMDNAGVSTELTNGTYETTGVIWALWSLTCQVK